MILDDARMDELADSLIESHERLLADLVDMRRRHKLSQSEVADRMGVSQPTVAAFERYDANPTLSSIRRYAFAVGAAISHSVDDRCHAADDSTFYAVVNGAAPSWAKAATVTWGPWGPVAQTRAEVG